MLGQRKGVRGRESGVSFMCTFEDFLLHLLKNSSSGCFSVTVFFTFENEFK